MSAIAIRIDGRSPRWRGFDFTAGMLPPGATFQRGTVATVMSDDGRAIVVPVDQPRYAAGGGLVLEGLSSNLLPDSRSVAGWDRDRTGSGAADPVVTAGPVAAPDGLAADRVQFDAGAGQSRLSRTIAGLGATAVHCFSIWLRSDAPGVGPALALNATVGAPAQVDAQWRRFVVSAPAVAGSATCRLVLDAAAGPATASIWAWGAQLEASANASLPIATGASAATRAKDRLTLDWARQGVADGAREFDYHFIDGGLARLGTIVSGGLAMMALPGGGRPIARIAAP
ncbi:phage head spike fiber domain-containing protein [Sphingomonas donggukensis]